MKKLLFFGSLVLLLGAGCNGTGAPENRPLSKEPVPAPVTGGVEQPTPSPKPVPAVAPAPATPPQAVRPTPTPAPMPNLTPAPAPKTVTILATADEFSPSTVTIRVGDTVKFISKDSGSRVWPASDPHPTHTTLSAFDVRHGMAFNEAYSFTFIKAGNWKFHNHLNPSARGTVTVTEK